MRAGVIGGGAWGTTLALLLSRQGHDVTLWVREPEVEADILKTQENKKFLPGIALPQSLRPTTEISDTVRDAEIIVMVVPSQFYRSVMKLIAAHIDPGAPILNATKGLEEGSYLRMSEIAEQEIAHLNDDRWAVLSGPNISKEIAKGLPAATVVASRSKALAATVQGAFMNDKFRVYTHSDIIGVELGGALKNVIALAAGIAEGLQLGDNAKSALMVRGMAEIARLGVALGGQPETFFGLSGMGDLMTTCMSPLSRNHRVGIALGRGESLQKIMNGMVDVAEGVPTARAALALAASKKIELPICQGVADVLSGISARDVLQTLMNRIGKSEIGSF